MGRGEAGSERTGREGAMGRDEGGRVVMACSGMSIVTGWDGSDGETDG